MSDQGIQIVVGGVQVVALAVLAALVKMWQDRNHAAVQDVKKEVTELKVNTDGKLDSLNKALVDAAGARGELKAKAEAKADVSEVKGT